MPTFRVADEAEWQWPFSANDGQELLNGIVAGCGMYDGPRVLRLHVFHGGKWWIPSHLVDAPRISPQTTFEDCERMMANAVKRLARVAQYDAAMRKMGDDIVAALPPVEPDPESN